MAHWETLDGWAAGRNFDPLELPFDRFLSWVYQWFTERLDEKAAQSFDMSINRPLPGMKPTTGVWSDDSMAAAFSSFTGEFGNG